MSRTTRNIPYNIINSVSFDHKLDRASRGPVDTWMYYEDGIWLNTPCQKKFAKKLRNKKDRKISKSILASNLMAHFNDKALDEAEAYKEYLAEISSYYQENYLKLWEEEDKEEQDFTDTYYDAYYEKDYRMAYEDHAHYHQHDLHFLDI